MNVRRFFRATWNASADYSDEKGVSLSVRLSVKRVHGDKTEERYVQIFIPYKRSFSDSFPRRRMVGEGRPLLFKILGQPAPVGAKSPISNRYSLVAPQP